MSLWTWKRSGWLNLSLGIFLIISVAVSVSSKGIRSGFREMVPYLSFRGDLYPEVGLYNFLLFCSAVIGFVSVGLRYSYITDQVQVMPAAINYLNKISLAIGAFSFLGLVITASFSASLIDDVILYQAVGTYLFIGMGVIFSLLQTILTYTSTRYSFIFIFRIFIAVSFLATFLSSIIFIEKSKVESSSTNITENSNNTLENGLLRNNETNIVLLPKDMSLLTACILEWVSVVMYALFFLSFFQEFQTISTYVIMRPFISTSSNDFRSSSFTVNERI